MTAIRDGVIQLFRMPAAGGPMQQLTTGYERMRHPFYSPDGKWIYIQPSHRNIYRVPRRRGRLEQVTRFPDAGPLPGRADDLAGRAVSLLLPEQRRLLALADDARRRASFERRSERAASDARRRHPPRSLRNPRAARRGRDGGGLPGAGYAARPRGRHQGPPAELVRRPRRRRQRFEREAKTISQLSHPHICALYDVGPAGRTSITS